MSHFDVFDRAVDKANTWLKELETQLDTNDRHHSYAVLAAVLQATRDRVGPEVAAHLAAQLPLVVRGVFYERWDPTSSPVRLSRAQFLERVERQANLKGTSEAEEATKSVYSLLWRELGEGTISHLLDVLPDEFADLV